VRCCYDLSILCLVVMYCSGSKNMFIFNAIGEAAVGGIMFGGIMFGKFRAGYICKWIQPGGQCLESEGGSKFGIQNQLCLNSRADHSILNHMSGEFGV
jgi:hypothetical protein